MNDFVNSWDCCSPKGCGCNTPCPVLRNLRSGLVGQLSRWQGVASAENAAMRAGRLSLFQTGTVGCTEHDALDRHCCY